MKQNTLTRSEGEINFTISNSTKELLLLLKSHREYIGVILNTLKDVYGSDGATGVYDKHFLTLLNEVEMGIIELISEEISGNVDTDSKEIAI
jgi:hypothetical protein